MTTTRLYAVWRQARGQLRRRWRSWLGLAVLVGLAGGFVITAAAGSRRTSTVYDRLLAKANPFDVLVGRVRVHIEHLGNAPNPNRILTPTAVISVRGTTFDISVDDDDETTLIEVEEGTVEVEHALLPRGNIKVLTTGESLRVYRNEPIAKVIDKGGIARQVLRSMVDAVITVATRMPNSGVGGIGGIGGGGIAHDFLRHSRESGNPGMTGELLIIWPWIPAFAGMTEGRGPSGAAAIA